MLKFSINERALVIERNGVAVYSVDPYKPSALEVGKGENTYKMSHGSFKISEQITERVKAKITSVFAEENSAVIETNYGKISLTVDGENLRADFEGFDGFNRMWLTLPSSADEFVYGSGEVFSEFNLKGKKANVWVAEHINALQIGKKLVKQVVGIKNAKKSQAFKNYETYYAQPTFISSKKYFFHSLCTARSELDFTADNVTVIKTDEIAPFYIGFGDSFEELLGNLTSIVGRQPELPDWVYDGHILGIQGGTDIMLSKIQTALNHNIPVNGAWIQDWEGRRVTAVGKQLFWNWEWDKELYPGLDEKIKELGEKGIKVLGYINPFLAVEKPLYKEASEKGYTVKNKDGEDYYVTITTFPAAMLDLTNPDAWEWIKNVIKKNMIELGFAGWMADFGEYLPTDCVLYSGEDPELVHNTWPARWAQVNREAVEEAGKLGEIMFFTRAGYSNTPRYSTMMWCGDNHTDFSIDFGLPSVIPAMLTLSCCGFGLSHSDVGGYTSFFNLKRSEELYMRWCEMNAFTPVLRGHEGLNPDLNAQHDASEAVLNHNAKMARLHKALKPYLKEAVKYNAENGVAVVRPLFFHYDEKEAFEEAHEYLLGRGILVAPVIRPNTLTREVYLPKDNWVHLWSGKEYKGGKITVNSPLGEPPVFIRKGAPVLEALKGAKNA
ncbi:MAG: alpha-glucosidase [Eubacterium sp.]|nr:alpha-glucosidase [Eubacterium sp.]